jgi:hypothetical protein
VAASNRQVSIGGWPAPTRWCASAILTGPAILRTWMPPGRGRASGKAGQRACDGQPKQPVGRIGSSHARRQLMVSHRVPEEPLPGRTGLSLVPGSSSQTHSIAALSASFRRLSPTVGQASQRPLRRRWPSVTKRSLMRCGRVYCLHSLAYVNGQPLLRQPVISADLLGCTPSPPTSQASPRRGSCGLGETWILCACFVRGA